MAGLDRMPLRASSPGRVVSGEAISWESRSISGVAPEENAATSDPEAPTLTGPSSDGLARRKHLPDKVDVYQHKRRMTVTIVANSVRVFRYDKISFGLDTKKMTILEAGKILRVY